MAFGAKIALALRITPHWMIAKPQLRFPYEVRELSIQLDLLLVIFRLLLTLASHAKNAC